MSNGDADSNGRVTEHILPIEVVGCSIIEELQEHGALKRVAFQICLDRLISLVSQRKRGAYSVVTKL